MFSSKLCRSRACREFRRSISKSSTDKNSDAISRQQASKLGLDVEMNVSKSASQRRWLKQMRHNNLRALSTIHQTLVKVQPATSLASKEESREFMAMFPDIIREVTDLGKHQELPEVMRRFAKMLQYTVPTGKKNRGLTVISSYKMLEDPEKQTPENIKRAYIIGWCVEMLQTFLLLQDDLMDGSETRRGSICWHRQPDVGLTVVNDCVFLENSMYGLLKKHLQDHPSYVPIMETFHETTTKTALGQCQDVMCTTPDGRPKLDKFTMNRYNSIAKYKTAYYTFHMPVAVAMYLANMYDPEQHRQAKTILVEMGIFFQIQDDFLDCFGDPSVTGKKGTDIQEGKCSWLAVVALQRASPAQRRIMEEYYGRPDPESIKIIKNLYEELSLPNTYAIYEEESYNIIKTHIQQISKGLPHKLFFKIMERLYKRES